MGFVNDFLETISSLFYYLRAGVAAVTSNTLLLVTSIIILLFSGRSLKLGKLFTFDSKSGKRK